jgi:hypothetical protein
VDTETYPYLQVEFQFVRPGSLSGNANVNVYIPGVGGVNTCEAQVYVQPASLHSPTVTVVANPISIVIATVSPGYAGDVTLTICTGTPTICPNTVAIGRISEATNIVSTVYVEICFRFDMV